MAFQTVFKRYELKYLLTRAQKKAVLEAISPHMSLDRYGRTTIRNIYFDTEHYRLIRRSIEKPLYKEKLRIRSYAQASPESTVFVELKKKYDGVVFKRRLALPEREAMDWVSGQTPCPIHTQLSSEIDYLLTYYGSLSPAVFLTYEREAYYCRDGGDLRVTFDENILCRETELSLCSAVGGTPLLREDLTLMEIKCAGGIPLWLAHALSANRIYKTSFSKYGTAYQSLIFPRLFANTLSNKETHIHA